MNKFFFAIIFIYCCSACTNEENIIPAKDKLTSKITSGKNNTQPEDDDEKDEKDEKNEKDKDNDKEKEKDKDKEQDQEKDKEEKKDKDKDKKDDDDDDDDDKKDKSKDKKDEDDKKKDDKKEDDDKKGKGKTYPENTDSFLYACEPAMSYNDTEARDAFSNKTWTAMIKNNAGQFEAYRLTTTATTITTSFASFSDCRTELSSYTAEVISHSWSGRAVNTGNADDSFLIGCMNNSYMEAIYPNGKILHFFNEDQILSQNIDRCKLKNTLLE